LTCEIRVHRILKELLFSGNWALRESLRDIRAVSIGRHVIRGLAGSHRRALLLELLIGNAISRAGVTRRGEILEGLKGREGRERSRRFEK